MLASSGNELGRVILDVGAARALTTTTLQNDMYAVLFDRQWRRHRRQRLVAKLLQQSGK